MSMNPDNHTPGLVPFRNAEQTVQAAQIRMEGEYQRTGSYYELVPLELRSIIDRLVRENFPHYHNQSPTDPRFQSEITMREPMAENWLLKTSVFGQLAEDAGFEAIQSLRSLEHNRDVANRFGYLALTMNASYLFAGTGAFRQDGIGAVGIYERIPLREGETHASNFATDAGVNGLTFNEMPEVGKRASTNLLQTSNLLLLYRKPMTPVDVQAESVRASESIHQSFSHIDLRTLNKK